MDQFVANIPRPDTNPTNVRRRVISVDHIAAESSLTQNRFTVEGITRGVPLQTLYAFYTDYSPEDVDIMRKHGMKMALERVAKKEGNRVTVDTTAKIMGMTKNMRYEITLHSEEFWYEMDITINRFANSRRSYRFHPVPDGTRIVINDEYHPLGLLSKMLNVLGMLKPKMIKDTTNTMNAFIAEAEERFANRPTTGYAGTELHA